MNVLVCRREFDLYKMTWIKPAKKWMMLLRSVWTATNTGSHSGYRKLWFRCIVLLKTISSLCTLQLCCVISGFVRPVCGFQSSYRCAAVCDVVITQVREGEGRISCVGGGIHLGRCNASRGNRLDFPLAAEWYALAGFPYNSVRSQCESAARGKHGDFAAWGTCKPARSTHQSR